MPNRLESVKLEDRILRGISQGYTNDRLIGDQVFKITPVDRESDKYLVYGKDQFVSYGDGLLRPLRQNAKIVDSEISTDKYSCDSHALGRMMEDREIAESYYDIANDETETATEQLRIGREVLQANMLTDVINYDVNHKDTPAITWDQASVNVVKEIDKYREAVRASIGRYPNTVVMGPSVFNIIKEKPEILEKIKYVQEGIATEGILASVLGMEKVLVGKAVHIPDTKTGVMTDVWGNICWIGFVDRTTNKKSPTYGRTFQKKGFPTVFKWWVQPRINHIEVEDLYDIKITAPGAGFLVTTPVTIV